MADAEKPIKRVQIDAKHVNEISWNEVRENLDWFSSLGLRLGGTESEREAAHYVAERLQRYGIEVELEEFPVYVSHAEDAEHFGPATVEVVSDGTTLQAKTYAFGVSTPPGGREADIVYAGTGTPDAYEALGVDAKDRIVLTELSFDAPHAEPTRVAQEHGAVGLIVMNWSDRDGPRIHTGTAKGVWGNPTPSDFSALPKIPVVSVSRSDGQRLRALLSGTSPRVRLHATNVRFWTTAVQPIAYLPGRIDEFVLFHGHLDSFGAGVTDNATGDVGLLEVARILNQHREGLHRGVKFAWWAAHEMPYAGSTWHLDTHWDEYRERCVAALNADAWALEGSEGNLVPMGFRELRETQRAALAIVMGDPPEPQDFGTKDADQTFWVQGIPSGMVISPTTDFPTGPFLGSWFHSEFDTREHVDEGALGQLLRVYLLMAHDLCMVASLPFKCNHVTGGVALRLNELVPHSPKELRVDLLARAARDLEAMSLVLDDRLETSGEADALHKAFMMLAHTLNPVLYTATGPYGQDPQAATYLRDRFPGLSRALDAWRAAPNEDERKTWLTQALRESNRISDALDAATKQLEWYLADRQ